MPPLSTTKYRDIAFGHIFSHLNQVSDNTYFYTVTLSPKQYSKPSLYQHKNTGHIVSSLCYKHTAHYGIMPEITKEGNIHYHFWATFNNPVNRYILLNDLKKQKQLGFIKLTSEPINNDESRQRVALYLSKECDITAKVLNIPYKHINTKQYNSTLNKCIMSDEDTSNQLSTFLTESHNVIKELNTKIKI